jgi:hypothetical protein
MSGLLFFAINCTPLMEPMSGKGGMKWNDNTWNNLCMYWLGADCTGQMRTKRGALINSRLLNLFAKKFLFIIGEHIKHL